MICARHRAGLGCAHGTVMLAVPADAAGTVPLIYPRLCRPHCAHWEPSHLALFQLDMWFGAGVCGEDPVAFPFPS